MNMRWWRRTSITTAAAGYRAGVLMTFADRTCGMTARYVSGRPTMATVQLDTHFVDSGKIGETLLSRPRVIRVTRSTGFRHHRDQRRRPLYRGGQRGV